MDITLRYISSEDLIINCLSLLSVVSDKDNVDARRKIIENKTFKNIFRNFKKGINIFSVKTKIKIMKIIHNLSKEESLLDV